MTKIRQRHSFSNQKDYKLSTLNSEEDLITVLAPAVDIQENIYPLTEENLAIHTNKFPPSKEARKKQVSLFVEDQGPAVKMYLILEKQRTLEIDSFIPVELPIIKFNQQGTTKINWLKRLAHWIHKRRHRGHHDICQKRDSGISFFSNHHQSTRSSRIVTAKHQNNDFAAYKYPKMAHHAI